MAEAICERYGEVKRLLSVCHVNNSLPVEKSSEEKSPFKEGCDVWSPWGPLGHWGVPLPQQS